MIRGPWHHLNHHVPIRQKIMLLFIPLLLIVLVLFGVVTDYLYQTTIKSLTKQHLNRVTETLKMDIEYRMVLYEKVAENIMRRNRILEILAAAGNKNISPAKILELNSEISKLLDENVQEDFKVKLYLFDSMLLSDGGYIENISSFPDKVLVSDIKKDSGGRKWTYRNDENGMVFIFARAMIDPQNVKPLGVLSIELNSELFKGIIEKTVDVTDQGWYELKFNDGLVITQKKDDNPVEEYRYVYDGFKLNELIFSVGYSEKKYYWMGRQIRLITLLLSILLAGVGMFATFLVSRIIVKRLKLFMKKMSSLSSVSVSTDQIKIPGSDEIAQIDIVFENMLNSLHEKMQQEYEMKVQQRITELELLQAQFNPHFLYNTIAAVRWSVLNRGDYRSADILDKLILFYRSILSGGSRIIPIKREIDMLKAYVEIHQYAFDRKYEFLLEIEPEVEKMFCPKQILQPLIENAILHGLEHNPNNGRIILCGWLDEDTIKFTIEDNGRGIPGEKLNILNQSEIYLSNEMKCGYGIWNVIQRIKLYYGEQYGLKFENVAGNGAKVTITIFSHVSDSDCKLANYGE